VSERSPAVERLELGDGGGEGAAYSGSVLGGNIGTASLGVDRFGQTFETVRCEFQGKDAKGARLADELELDAGFKAECEVHPGEHMREQT
jgi:hypothetical protein